MKLCVKFNKNIFPLLFTHSQPNRRIARQAISLSIRMVLLKNSPLTVWDFRSFSLMICFFLAYHVIFSFLYFCFSGSLLFSHVNFLWSYSPECFQGSHWIFVKKRIEKKFLMSQRYMKYCDHQQTTAKRCCRVTLVVRNRNRNSETKAKNI